MSSLIWRLLTDEGGGGQLALVHAADGAVGAHGGAARPQAVQHLARLDQRLASQARRQFTVSLRRHQHSRLLLYDSP